MPGWQRPDPRAAIFGGHAAGQAHGEYNSCMCRQHVEPNARDRLARQVHHADDDPGPLVHVNLREALKIVKPSQSGQFLLYVARQHSEVEVVAVRQASLGG